MRACACVCVCVQSCITHCQSSLISANVRQTHIHTAAHTCLMANHVWVLIHRIRSLIELDQHVLALRGFLHMHFVCNCNRHCYYHCCYSGERIISADYRQLFKRCFKKTSYTTHSVSMYCSQRERNDKTEEKKRREVLCIVFWHCFLSVICSNS